MFFLRRLVLLAVAFSFTACVSIREGRVVEKRSRKGMFDVYATWLTVRYADPDVYWVAVEGRDQEGIVRRKNIVLYERDWQQLRVGDHWSSERGFAPAESYEK